MTSSSVANISEAITRISEALALSGFDIAQPFNIGTYNSYALENPRLPRFPDFERTEALALLIGNTRLAWEPFLADYKSQAQTPDNPFDSYAERVVKAALKDSPMPYKLRFGHHSGDEFVSLLHACEASGFAKVSPANLAIHPKHGLWFGLRAVAVFDSPPLQSKPQDWVSPCVECARPCKAVTDALMTKHNNDWMACSWQERVSVRDACPVAPDARYSPAQIRYHYSRDRSALK